MGRAALGRRVPDRWNLSYFSFVLLGAGFLLPWNAFITASDYYEYVYPGKHADRLFTVAYLPINFVLLVFIVAFPRVFPPSPRARTGLVAMSLSMVAGLTLVSALPGGGGPGGLVGHCVAVGVAGAADALAQGSLFGFAATLGRPRYTQALVAGTALSGVAVCFLRIVCKALVPGPEGPKGSPIRSLSVSAIVYFAVGSFVCLLCVVVHAVVVPRRPDVRALLADRYSVLTVRFDDSERSGSVSYASSRASPTSADANADAARPFAGDAPTPLADAARPFAGDAPTPLAGDLAVEPPPSASPERPPSEVELALSPPQEERAPLLDAEADSTKEGRGSETGEPGERDVALPGGGAGRGDLAPALPGGGFRREGLASVLPPGVASTAAPPPPPPLPLPRLLRAVALPLYAVSMAHVITLAIFPGVLTEDVSSASLGDWYGIWLVTAFNVADLAGKSLAGYAPARIDRPRLLAALATLRVLFLPAFFLAAKESATGWVFALTALLGASHGLVAASAMVLAPAAVPKRDAEMAGNAMVLGLVAGLNVGAGLSFLWLL